MIRVHGNPNESVKLVSFWTELSVIPLICDNIEQYSSYISIVALLMLDILCNESI